MNISTKKYRQTIFIMLAIGSLLLSGCATPLDPEKVDPELVIQFKSPDLGPNKTGAFFIRSNSISGVAWPRTIAVNEYELANLGIGEHIYLELEAGLNSVYLNFDSALKGAVIPLDNLSGETFFLFYDAESGTDLRILEPDVGKTMVMQTKKGELFQKKRDNKTYHQLMANPDRLLYKLMRDDEESVRPDESHAVIRFYRPDWFVGYKSYAVWNQNEYLGSSYGGTQFSVKVKPGRHTFMTLSNQFSTLSAELEANKEYAVEINAGLGNNQASVQLIPIDLKESRNLNKVSKWKSELRAISTDRSVVEHEKLIPRLEIGRDIMQKMKFGEISAEGPSNSMTANYGN